MIIKILKRYWNIYSVVLIANQKWLFAFTVSGYLASSALNGHLENVVWASYYVVLFLVMIIPSILYSRWRARSLKQTLLKKINKANVSSIEIYSINGGYLGLVDSGRFAICDYMSRTDAKVYIMQLLNIPWAFFVLLSRALIGLPVITFAMFLMVSFFGNDFLPEEISAFTISDLIESKVLLYVYFVSVLILAVVHPLMGRGFVGFINYRSKRLTELLSRDVSYVI